MKMLHQKSYAARRAFSFLEIMLVVMIIGIMLAVIGPRLVGKSKKAKITATKLQMQNVAQALGMYEADNGEFPSTEQGLEALVEQPNDVDEDTWQKYLDDVPLDSWKKKFDYKYPGENGEDFNLISSGPDRRMGTDDDIRLHEDEEESDF